MWKALIFIKIDPKLSYYILQKKQTNFLGDEVALTDPLAFAAGASPAGPAIALLIANFWPRAWAECSCMLKEDRTLDSFIFIITANW